VAGHRAGGISIAEREIAGERIRDKIAASKTKGKWMGGNVPLGYDVRERKLVVSEAEASTVRMIFQRYAELGSVALLKAELERAGIVSKRGEGADGELSGGKRFSRGTTETPKIAGQRLGRASLTRGNYADSHTSGNDTPEGA
jgi:hypothetical protein